MILHLSKEGETVIHYVAEIEKSMLNKELDDADIIKLLLDYDADVDYHTRLVREIHFFSCTHHIINFIVCI
jgi:hypothetical protein